MPQTKNTPAEWDRVRTGFANSIMVDTRLSSLAQSLDGADWPIKDADETPAKYIDLGFDEVVKLLALKGQPAGTIDLLIGILSETLAFDNPFGEMVEQTAAAAARDNPVFKNMARLGIPEGFPIDLTTLDADALEFCRTEKLSTLGEFAVFAQGMSQNVIVGGDFRRLLNALSHVDEAVLAELLPLRRGGKGLHLIEALAQAARTPAPEPRVTRAIAWFQVDLADMRRAIASGETLPRLLAVLGDPAKERKIAPWLSAALGPAPKPAGAEAGRGGLLGSLARMFRK